MHGQIARPRRWVWLRRRGVLAAPLVLLAAMVSSVGWSRPAFASEGVSWSAAAAMPTGRGLASVAVLDGKIYVMGGTDNYSDSLSAVEVYDPATDTWATRAPMLEGRQRGAAAASGGRIYVIGGHMDGTDTVATVEVYDPVSDSWSHLPNAPVSTDDPSAVTGPDGMIYLFGGYPGCCGSYLNNAYRYDPALGTWTQLASMPTARQGSAAAVAADGKIYVLGGNSSTDSERVMEAYDPVSNTWASRSPAPYDSSFGRLVAGPDGNLYAFGTFTDTGIVMRYNPVTDTWSTAGSLPLPRTDLVAANPGNGHIYVIGGADSNSAFPFTWTSDNLQATIADTGPPQAPIDWSTYQANTGHTGYQAAEASLRPPLTSAWTLDTGDAGPATIVTSGGTLYAHTGSGTILAIDDATGTLRWQAETNDGGGTLVVANNLLYAAGYCATCNTWYIAAYDTATGDREWTSDPITAGVNGLNLVDGVLYFGGEHVVYAMDASTGHLLWGRGVDDAVFSVPVVANGEVFVGAYQRTFYALNASNGSSIWELSGRINSVSSPALANNLLYMGSEGSGPIFALDPTSGAIHWSYGAIGGLRVSPAVASGVLYAQGQAGTLAAVDATTGAPLWNAHLGSGYYYYGTLAIANGVVYAGSDAGNTLYALDASNGTTLWQYHAPDVPRYPIVADHRLYFSTDNGEIFAFTNVTAPATPTVASVAPGNHSATITWLRPNDGGSPIVGYTVTATPGGQTCSTDSADALSCTITGLTNGVDYTFTVTARNAVGSSPPPPPGSGTGDGTPTGTSTPGPPPNPVGGVTPSPNPDGTEVTLHWLAAASDLPIIGYTATAQPGGHSCSTDGALSCTITGLDPNTDYAFTVVAINAAGSSDPSPPVQLDTQAPTVAGTPDRGPDHNGWYTAPVTVTWATTDPSPSSGTPTSPPATVMSGDGTGQTATSQPSCDPAGNCATGTFGPVNIDTTPPVVTITGVTNAAAYLTGMVPAAACNTIDVTSGVAMPATLTTTGSGPGTVTATCTGGTDEAGNTAAPVSVTYTLIAPVRAVTSSSHNSVGNNSLTATIPDSGVAAGDTLTIAVATGTFAGAVGCTDTQGNNYTVATDRNTGNGRLFVCTAHLTHALTATDTVTATYPGFSGISLLTANAISTLATNGGLDITATASGNSATPTVGPVITTQPQELLYAVIASNSTSTATAGSGFTAVGQVSAGTGSAKRTLTPEYQLTTSAGSYTATVTLSAGQFWQAGIVAYHTS